MRRTRTHIVSTTTAMGMVLSLSAYAGHAQTAAEDTDASGVVTLDTVVLTGTGDAETAYRADSTIGRVATDPKHVAQTITSVTAKRISDQNIRSNLDLLQSSPGVDVTGNEGFTRVRGYSAQSAIDGISVGSFVGRTSADLTPFEQVEILKGPASLFAGSGSPGGTINYTFKRPRDAESLEFKLGAGDPSSKLITMDYNFAPAMDGRLRARVVGSWEDRDLTAHPERFDRLSVYGVTEFDLTDRTTFRLGYWHQREDSVRSFRQALPAYSDGGLIDFPKGTTPTQDWNLYKFRANWLNLDLEHKFNDRWSGKLSFRKGSSEHPSIYAVARSGICSGPNADIGYISTGIDRANPDGRQCFGAEWWSDYNDNEIYDATLTGSVNAFGRSHDVVLGFTQENSWFRRVDGLHANPADEFILDIFNPNSHVRGPLPIGPMEALEAKGTPSEKYNLFGQITINATDRLRFPVGGRFTWLKTSDGDWTAKGEFTPSLGVVYDVTPEITAYAQFSRMFTANTSSYGWNPAWESGEAHAAEDGVLLPNVTGTQREIGIKADVFGGLALATASIFEIKEQNRAREDTDPDHPYLGSSPFRVATGETRSRGAELSLVGEIRPGWDIGIGYAYIDAKYIKDDSVQGVAIGTAKHSGNIWTNYNFTSGSLDGLSLGGGLRFSGKFKGSTTDADDTNRVKAPGYGVVSARAGYRINDNFTAVLNVDNLFDKTYYEIAGSVGSGNYHGEGRRVSLNLTGRF
ncbi:MAG: TonB-dependent siderophore receptor [Paracoccus sp. (in: a-proteobacteria)]|uniref:TonB-dependent siderophore receptor n=1 Tax=Paracoccus sp. TaxID=267 RepID=UPI0039E33F85